MGHPARRGGRRLVALAALALVTAALALAETAGSEAGASGEPEISELTSLACVAATNCRAVGYVGTNVFNEGPLAARWNGTRWVDSPITADTGEPTNILEGVACASTSFCWAVGSTEEAEAPYSLTPLADLWNGNRWAAATTPAPASNFAALEGVACVSRSDCWAVGSYHDASGAAAPYAERWTESNEGSHWAIGKIADPAGARAGTLHSVACESSRDCLAVGSYTTAAGKVLTLAEHFDGTRWSITSPKNPADAKVGSYLDGVACSGPSSCTAVGYAATTDASFQPLAERWDGSGWSLATVPGEKGASGSFLNAVACGSTTSCWAVGYWTSAAGVFPFVARSSTRTWRTVRAPGPAGPTETFLTSVACRSATSCLAVGYDEPAAGGSVTLGERWNGSAWRIVATPDGTG